MGKVKELSDMLIFLNIGLLILVVSDFGVVCVGLVLLIVIVLEVSGYWVLVFDLIE